MRRSSSRRPKFHLTWFKIGLLVVLGIGAISLCTPYPAQLVRSLRQDAKGRPDDAPGNGNKKPRSSRVSSGAPAEAASTGHNSEGKAAASPQAGLPEQTDWSPEGSFTMPEIHLPPFPPALPERVEPGQYEHLNSIANGLNLRSTVLFRKGSTAAQDRHQKKAYMVCVGLEMLLPHAADGKELLTANPLLPQVLRQYPALMEKAKVSRWYHALYLHKQNLIRKNAATLTRLLDRHNFFDTDTILELEAPESARKVLWIQADMDVVSDGSDGDRLPTMPEKIRKSDFYQPTTSYRWKKRTATPNPLLSRWQEKLDKLQKTKGSNPESIRHARRVVNDLKSYSYLLAQYDPFIVVPLTLKEGKDNAHRPEPGDYAAVIVGKRVFPAIVGDFGPRYKSGEASLRLCKMVNPRAEVNARPVSDLGVSYVIFPGTKEEQNGPIDYPRLNQRCRELLEELGGLGDEAEFCEMTDLLAPPAPPAASPKEEEKAE